RVVAVGGEVQLAGSAAGNRQEVFAAAEGARLADQAGLAGDGARGGGVQAGIAGGVDFTRGAVHVPDGDETVGGVEHGGGVARVPGVGVAPVHADGLRGVVALDGVDLHPDGGAGAVPRFDVVRQGRHVV